MQWPKNTKTLTHEYGLPNSRKGRRWKSREVMAMIVKKRKKES